MIFNQAYSFIFPLQISFFFKKNIHSRKDSHCKSRKNKKINEKLSHKFIMALEKLLRKLSFVIYRQMNSYSGPFMTQSPLLEQAAEILENVSGNPLSMQERKKLTIELSAILLKAANRSMTREERKIQKQLSRLMKDPIGKAFTTAMTDESFRSTSN